MSSVKDKSDSMALFNLKLFIYPHWKRFTVCSESFGVFSEQPRPVRRDPNIIDHHSVSHITKMWVKKKYLECDHL